MSEVRFGVRSSGGAGGNMQVVYRRCGGLDVHKDTITATVLVFGEEGQRDVRKQEFGTHWKELQRLGKWLRTCRVERVAMESTGVYWKPVWNVLEKSLALVLANPYQVKNIPSQKTDRRDSEWIADLLQNSDRLGRPKIPQVWVPFAQSPWPNAVVAVRTAIDPQKMTKAIAGVVHTTDPNLPLANIKTVHQLALDKFVEDRFGIALYGSLAGLALLLASFGIYGVMSFAVAQSTAEIGVRIALGATTSDVVRSVLKQGLGMAGVGLALGFVGAYVTDRAMQSSLYGTGAVDWGAFSAVAILLLIVALLACYVPAQRASSIDPMIALRQG